MDNLIRITDSEQNNEEYDIAQSIIINGFWVGIATTEVFENFDAPIKQKIGSVSRFNISFNLYFISNDVKYEM